MRKSILIKAFGMIAVFGAMVLWSCSQDEEIEEQTEWSKKAVKKSLARTGKLICQENYSTDITFTFPTIPYLTEKGHYEIYVEVYEDSIARTYEHKAGFSVTPNNPPLTEENVHVNVGPQWYLIEIVVTANASGLPTGYSFTDILPHPKDGNGFPNEY